MSPRARDVFAIITLTGSHPFVVFLGSLGKLKSPGALANQSRGGVMLIGVDDAGNVKGISRDTLDELKLRISSTISRNCQPCPAFHLLDFDDPFNAQRCTLIVHIQELENKPCMSEDKVYIRAGSESRLAKSEEIRRPLIR